MRHLASSDVFGLTIEKLFTITGTELERMGHKHQGLPLHPLCVPVPLWAVTTAYVAATLERERGDSDLDVIGSQFCGTFVFNDSAGRRWDEARFSASVTAALTRGKPFAEERLAWRAFVQGRG